MGSPWDFNLDDYMNDVNKKNLLGLDAEEPSLVKPSDYEYSFDQPSAYAPAELVSSGYEARRNDLQQQQERAENNAMDYLRQSLNKSAEVTPTQGFAAALLAAIPTLGGYMIGKSVGEPELPPGYFEAGGTRAAAGLDKYQTGANAGGLAGVQIGGKSAGIFLEGLDANQAQANDAYSKMAQVESQKAGRLESQLGSLENQQIAREDNQAFQQQMYGQRLQDRPPVSGGSDIMKYGTDEQKAAYLAERAGVDAEGNVIDKPFTKDRVLVPSNKDIEKASSADALPALQQRVRGLYEQAIKQVGPGFAQAYIRQGMKAFPANIQQEFTSTLQSMAMEMNRVLDPTPSDAGMRAQLSLLEGSIANGSFPNLLDFKVKSARQAALAGLEPFTLGENANPQAKLMYEMYKNKWGLGEQEPVGGGSPTANRKAELQAAIAAEKAKLGVK